MPTVQSMEKNIVWDCNFQNIRCPCGFLDILGVVVQKVMFPSSIVMAFTTIIAVCPNFSFPYSHSWILLFLFSFVRMNPLHWFVSAGDV